MTERDLQRWSREVAEDPGAPSFVQLARAYRRQGRTDAARETILRGLTVHPEHIEAHAVLALIHVQAGERQQAGDEWETILQLEPENFDARRGLGFLALEQGDLASARRHLDAAIATRPDEPSVQQARRVLARREQRPGSETATATATASRSAANAAAADGRTDTDSAASQRSTSSPVSETSGERQRSGAVTRDPATLFSSMTADAPFRGALLLDNQGLILAGRLEEAERSEDVLAAQLAAAVAEAQRSVEILDLRAWEDMLLETPRATIHLTALRAGAVLVMVADPQAPPGWVVRAAAGAVDLASRFLEEDR